MSDSGGMIKGYDPASLGSPTGPPPRGGRGSRNKVGPKFIFHLSGARRPKRAQNSWQDTHGVGAAHPKRGLSRALFYSNTPFYYYTPQSFVHSTTKTIDFRFFRGRGLGRGGTMKNQPNSTKSEPRIFCWFYPPPEKSEVDRFSG